MTKKINLSEIKISKAFAKTRPSLDKTYQCLSYYLAKGKQDRIIEIDDNGTLTDGYIMYLVLKKLGVEKAKVKMPREKRLWQREKPTTYVYGIHSSSISSDIINWREYVWRVPEKWTNFKKDVKVGDEILCATQYGLSPVIVTRIEKLKESPVEFRVKKVVRKLSIQERY